MELINFCLLFSLVDTVYIIVASKNDKTWTNEFIILLDLLSLRSGVSCYYSTLPPCNNSSDFRLDMWCSNPHLVYTRLRCFFFLQIYISQYLIDALWYPISYFCLFRICRLSSVPMIYWRLSNKYLHWFRRKNINSIVSIDSKTVGVFLTPVHTFTSV